MFRYVSINREAELPAATQKTDHHHHREPAPAPRRDIECSMTIRTLNTPYCRTPNLSHNNSLITLGNGNSRQPLRSMNTISARDTFGVTDWSTPQPRAEPHVEPSELLLPSTVRTYGQLATPAVCRHIYTSLTPTAIRHGSDPSTPVTCMTPIMSPNMNTPMPPPVFDFSQISRPLPTPKRDTKIAIVVNAVSLPGTPSAGENRIVGPRKVSELQRQDSGVSRPVSGQQSQKVIKLRRCGSVAQFGTPQLGPTRRPGCTRPSLFKMFSLDPTQTEVKPVPIETSQNPPQIRVRRATLDPDSNIVLPTGVTKSPVPRLKRVGTMVELLPGTPTGFSRRGTLLQPQEGTSGDMSPMTAMLRSKTARGNGALGAPEEEKDPKNVPRSLTALPRGPAVNFSPNKGKTDRSGVSMKPISVPIPIAAAQTIERKLTERREGSANTPSSRRNRAGSMMIETPTNSSRLKTEGTRDGAGTPQRRSKHADKGKDSPGKLKRSESVVAALGEKYRTYGTPKSRKRDSADEPRLEHKETSYAEKRRVWKGGNGVFSMNRLRGWYQHMEHQ